MKFGRVIFEICERTDRQTDRQAYRHADRNNLASYRGRSNNIAAVAAASQDRKTNSHRKF